MYFSNFTFIVIIFLLFGVFCTETDKQSNSNDAEETFVPTNEWQVVKKGNYYGF